eukprot:2144275-Heterocapsa_arctica.AAC.1
MDTSSIVVPEVMKQWRKREEESIVEHKKQRSEKELDEMELMVVEASAARADRVGKKGESKTDFTCDDYETEEMKDWWDE